MTRRRRTATRPRLEALDGRLLLAVLTPAQIDSAYGLNTVAFSGGTIQGSGAGQTIAIVDPYHDPAIWGDLVAFDARNGLPNPYITGLLPAKTSSAGGQPAFTLLNFAGSTTNGSWNVEEALDVEMAHAAAPRANIVLVEAKSSGLFDLLGAIRAVKTLPSVSVISMSWGGPEFDGQQSFDSIFTTPAGHAGITYLASTGDDGAGAQWPASSPNVVAVGGTTLSVGTTGARAAESAWLGSGGGSSQFATKPAYQAQAVPGTARTLPDVSIDADPSSGVIINNWGGTLEVGGTSLSAPLWAGLIAVADQGLTLQGSSSLDGATQTLPALYAAPSGSFYDIAAGSRATPGYDASTGLGSPNAQTLIGFLDGKSGGKATTTGGGTTITVGGTGTTGTGTKSQATANLAFAGSTPAAAVPAASAPAVAPIPAQPPLVPDFVAAPPSPIAQDPAATDAALESWGPVARVGSAGRPRIGRG